MDDQRVIIAKKEVNGTLTAAKDIVVGVVDVVWVCIAAETRRTTRKSETLCVMMHIEFTCFLRRCVVSLYSSKSKAHATYHLLLRLT
mmetsp:Transcript_13941/g.20407  ORF Transcript_13941/g.20407 Transcript_13941/m.20407 type:complete len:87 (-) Transcript_13941:46-306(-)